MRDDGRPPLESVDRALQLIEALRDGRTLTVKAAAEMLGVAPSTAHRLLNALRYREFARQVDDRGYRAGPALSGEDEAFTPEELTVAARPALELLHDRTDESSQLMIRRGTDIQFLDGVESTRPLRVAVRIGDRIPAHCSAGGKALLARLDGPAFDQLYAQGPPAVADRFHHHHRRPAPAPPRSAPLRLRRQPGRDRGRRQRHRRRRDGPERAAGGRAHPRRALGTLRPPPGHRLPRRAGRGPRR
ncbi:DNA-binding IclR family transcriptional regulator [Nocardioides soli]|uniref:DNA-binding IclR family transcriptional regulator n=1 Tax=Nocardioides soli TaxID=1036020 RepID=A0A7W4Z571_9ACTN|nr:helix-turn-helix domain-containing protein [Nocardioides soli]MBB3045631.1 DNA-binding IclR family transcriptional regulator [Nocardioides soli]